MSRQLHRAWITTVASISLLLISGCRTYNAKIPTFTDYPEQQAYDTTVALVLSEEYAGHICDVPSRSYRVSLGNALERNSIYVAKKLFNTVHVVKGASAGIPKDAVAILKPSIVSDCMSGSMSAFDKSEYVIDVEWTLEDRQGNLVWLKTIRGKAKNAAGSLGSIRLQAGKRIRAALEDLFGKTYEAIRIAPAIREFVEQQGDKR